jgi:hypothetical protein
MNANPDTTPEIRSWGLRLDLSWTDYERKVTVNLNANKFIIFRYVGQHLVQFLRILQKQGSILGNLLPQKG